MDRIDIVQEVKDAAAIGISGHIKPDGDCIGSSVALFLYLKKHFPDKIIKLYLQDPGHAFRNIPGREEIDSSFEKPMVEPFDVFILLDTVPDRMGNAYPMYQSAKKTINIDHHISNEDGAGMVNYVVPTASATAELIYDLMDKTYVDQNIAALIYLGISHDTGIFKFSNTSPKTMRIVADLLEYGFDFSKLIDETYYEKSWTQNKVMGQIILDSQLYYDGKVIVGAIDRNTMQVFGAGKGDFDGVVNQLRITAGVECAVFLYEKEPGLFKISLRASTDLVDVSVIATTFGGGGHVRAAGFDCRGGKKEIIDRLLEEIGKQVS
ncbi:MAG: bifunctional oligoribonuclease/PAP phosphatase NrnA [Lachnospiraceae bacterium]